MRLRDKYLSFVVNFLLGVAWAAAFVGAVSTFLAFYPDSFFLAIVSAFIAALPGLIGILLLEHVITGKETYLELTKQTKLLEELLEKEQKN